MTIDLRKGNFGKNEIRFLRHVITPKEISPATVRIEAILDFLLPKTVKGLRRFTGMLQFYSPYIKCLSCQLASLCDMIKSKHCSRSTLKWTSQLKKAFEASKDCLANFAAMTFPKLNTKILLVGQ